jgi:hypothetical protein
MDNRADSSDEYLLWVGWKKTRTQLAAVGDKRCATKKLGMRKQTDVAENDGSTPMGSRRHA